MSSQWSWFSNTLYAGEWQQATKYAPKFKGISADQPWYALCLRLINAEMRHHQLAFGKTSRQDALSAVMEDIRNSMKSFLDEKEISSIAQQDLDEIRGILNFADKRTSVVLAVSKFCQPERPFKPSMYTDIIQELLVFEPGDALIDSEIAALSHLLCFQEALDTFQLTKASVAMFQSGKYLKNLSIGSNFYAWLRELFDALFQHYEIMFHRIIKEKEAVVSLSTGQKRKGMMQSMIDRLCMEVRPLSFALVYQVQQDETIPYHSKGFAMKDLFEEKPTGISSFPVVYQTPAESLLGEHIPNIISIIMFSKQSLDNWNRGEPITFYDKKMDITYFIEQARPNHYLLLLLNGKRDDDTAVSKIFEQIAILFRHLSLIKRLGA